MFCNKLNYPLELLTFVFTGVSLLVEIQHEKPFDQESDLCAYLQGVLKGGFLGFKEYLEVLVLHEIKQTHKVYKVEVLCMYVCACVCCCCCISVGLHEVQEHVHVLKWVCIHFIHHIISHS